MRSRYKSWGGRPSGAAMSGVLGSRYLPTDSSDRIRGKLRNAVSPDASDRSLFLYAMALAEADSGSRSGSFNGAYAYHRALLVSSMLLLGIGVASARYGALRHFSAGVQLALSAVAVALIVLLWHRCRQRAFYYVREVLLTAERLLDRRAGAAARPE